MQCESAGNDNVSRKASTTEPVTIYADVESTKVQLANANMTLWWANATAPVKGNEMGEGEMQQRNQLHDKLLPKFKLNWWSSR